MLYVEPKYTYDEDTFTVEELDAEEFKNLKLDSSLIIHPYQYEDAESDCESKISHERTNSTAISDFKSSGESRLSTSQKPMDDYKTCNESKFARTEYRCTKKKRPLSTDTSSDLGLKDQQLGNSDTTDPGVFLRRIRRRVGDHNNFVFDDSPKRIDQAQEVAVRRELKKIDGCFRSFIEKGGDKNRNLPRLGMAEIMDFDYDLNATKK